MATATSEATPAMASAARPVMVFSPNWMARNTATVIAIAAPTPSHTHLSASRRSDLTRNATRIEIDDGGLEAFPHADQTAAEQL